MSTPTQPSKEAMQAAKELFDSGDLGDSCNENAIPLIATIIDTALAPDREQVRRLVDALCESIESGVPLPDNVRKALDPLLPNLTELAGRLSHVEGDSVEIVRKMRDEW